MLLSTLRNSPNKNHIVFSHKGNKYLSNILGDDANNVFNRNLMNIYLEQYEETIGIVTYDDIEKISVIENRNLNLTDFPNQLTHLFIVSSMCESIQFGDNIKPHLQHVSILKSNLNVLPNIDGCNKLKTFKINMANLQSFTIDYDLPSSLYEYNLSNNCITNHHFSYNKLEHALTTNKYLTLNYRCNHLNYAQFSDNIINKCKILNQSSYKFNRITIRNVGEEQINQFMNRPKQNVLDTTQTVHLTSVNIAVKNSIDLIQKYIKDNNINIVNMSNNILHSNTCMPFLNKNIYNYFKLTFPKTHQILQKLIVIPTINSNTKLTYAETFDLVWAVFAHLVEKNNSTDIFERLSIEINESDGFCFTGIYNRLINSLVGILDGVYVGISSREEFQLAFGRILTKLNETTVTNKIFANSICEAKELIKQYELNDGDVWIESLIDLAPDKECFTYEETIYLIDWEDFIYERKFDNYNKLINTPIYGYLENEKIFRFPNYS